MEHTKGPNERIPFNLSEGENFCKCLYGESRHVHST